MDFNLSEEHLQVVKVVRDYCRKEVAPVIKEADRTQTMHPSILQRMGELGILGICVPEKYGGQGFDYTFGKRSPWIDYYGKRGDFIEGLAIFQHPSNPGYPAPWFTRDYGFISPTPMFWPENGVETFFKKGEILRLQYRVLVHSGSVKEAKIKELYEIYKHVIAK